MTNASRFDDRPEDMSGLAERGHNDNVDISEAERRAFFAPRQAERC
jgi:hypothetical protein